MKVKKQNVEVKVKLDNKKAMSEIKKMQKIIDKASTVLKENFKGKMKAKIQQTLVRMCGLMFVTFLGGNLLVIMGILAKPTFKEWCTGTMLLLVGGGVMSAGKGLASKDLREKIINKG